MAIIPASEYKNYIDINYFKTQFNTDYSLDENEPAEVSIIQKYSNIGMIAVLSLIGEDSYDPDKYTEVQVEAIKISICIFIDHWLRNGFNFQPTGTQTLNAVGFNNSVTNPQDPEFVPKNVTRNLIRVGLMHNVLAVGAFGPRDIDGLFGIKINKGKWGI